MADLYDSTEFDPGIEGDRSSCGEPSGALEDGSADHGEFKALLSFRRNLGGERRQMILLSIYEVAEKTTGLVAYEDIVVAAWKLFPHEFGLRGYAEDYPDSWSVRRPLYGPLEREGYIRVQRGRVALTNSGLAAAEQLRAPNRSCLDVGSPTPSRPG